MTLRTTGRRVLVDAIRYDGTNTDRIIERFAPVPICDAQDLFGGLAVETHEGVRYADVGDWVVRDTNGAVFPLPAHAVRED